MTYSEKFLGMMKYINYGNETAYGLIKIYTLMTQELKKYNSIIDY